MSTYTAATVPTQFVEANGIRFAYRRWGKRSGLPLVFNQHFTGNLDNWDPAVLDGNRVVNIDQIAPPHLVVNVNWVGKRTPLHCTSNGKVLLACLPNLKRARLLRGRLERLTPNTIVDKELLQAQLLEAEARGYAYTAEELEVGLNAVAAPVRDSGGGAIAAVSVSGPAYRFTRGRIPEVGGLARKAGADIARRMGFTAEAASDSVVSS